MANLTTLEFLLRLAVGVSCGALIGVERQWRARMAGLRTNALVAAGATLFVLNSVAVGGADSTRVASYVVSGVGFLGAGVILREGGGVRGLNTAATLWCSAAAGVLAASGRLALCAIGTAVVLGVHLLLRPAGRLIDRVPQRDPDIEGVRATVHLVCDRADESHVRALLSHAIAGEGLSPTGLRVLRDGEDTSALRAGVLLHGDPGRSLEQLIARLSREPGVRDLHWHLYHGPLDTERDHRDMGREARAA
jgi:putative Mg2+ transporter-C (MgtC) family protein